MSFIASMFKGGTKKDENPPSMPISGEYHTVLYPNTAEKEVQVDDATLKVVYIVSLNGNCVKVFISESKAQRYIENYVFQLLTGTNRYRIINGRSTFIYTEGKLTHKLTYASLVIED